MYDLYKAMDLTNNNNNNNNINTTTTNKTPDTQIDHQSPPPPPQNHPTKNTNNNKSLSFTNVSFLHPHHHPQPPPPPPRPEFMVVSYKECLKNHAASLGGHALDGCGEFMPSPTSNSKDPTSLKCAACGCHRNFHRRYPYDHHQNHQQPITTHYSLPPPPAAGLHRSSSPSCTDPSTGPSLDPTSPQPVTSPTPCSYFSSAPHMLLALSSGYSGPPDDHHQHHYTHHTGGFTVTKSENPIGRKRSRTKFTQVQKDKMYSFAEKLGWRMLKSEEKSMQDFCSDVGVSRRVFKVWMHNHKNAFGKKGLDINNQIINDFVNGGNNNNNNNNHNEATLNLAISPKSED